MFAQHRWRWILQHSFFFAPFFFFNRIKMHFIQMHMLRIPEFLI